MTRLALKVALSLALMTPTGAAHPPDLHEKYFAFTAQALALPAHSTHPNFLWLCRNTIEYVLQQKLPDSAWETLLRDAVLPINERAIAADIKSKNEILATLGIIVGVAAGSLTLEKMINLTARSRSLKPIASEVLKKLHPEMNSEFITSLIQYVGDWLERLYDAESTPLTETLTVQSLGAAVPDLRTGAGYLFRDSDTTVLVDLQFRADSPQLYRYPHMAAVRRRPDAFIVTQRGLGHYGTLVQEWRYWWRRGHSVPIYVTGSDHRWFLAELDALVDDIDGIDFSKAGVLRGMGPVSPMIVDERNALVQAVSNLSASRLISTLRITPLPTGPVPAQYGLLIESAESSAYYGTDLPRVQKKGRRWNGLDLISYVDAVVLDLHGPTDPSWPGAQVAAGRIAETIESAHQKGKPVLIVGGSDEPLGPVLHLLKERLPEVHFMVIGKAVTQVSRFAAVHGMFPEDRVHFHSGKGDDAISWVEGARKRVLVLREDDRSSDARASMKWLVANPSAAAVVHLNPYGDLASGDATAMAWAHHGTAKDLMEAIGLMRKANVIAIGGSVTRDALNALRQGLPGRHVLVLARGQPLILRRRPLRDVRSTLVAHPFNNAHYTPVPRSRALLRQA